MSYTDQRYELSFTRQPGEPPPPPVPPPVVPLEWGAVKYSKVFGGLANQDLKASPVFDTHWTAGKTTRAVTMDVAAGAGVVCQPVSGTNWTAGGAGWDSPYISAQISDLLGFTPDRSDWIAIILSQSIDSETLPGAGVFDSHLNYGTSHAGLENYRNEIRSAMTTVNYTGAGHIRTYAGVQAGAPNTNGGGFISIMEAQIRGGVWRGYRAESGASFPTAPGQITVVPTTSNFSGIEDNNPATGVQYNPATDVVAMSAYNNGGPSRVITWERLDIYHVSMSELL